ncbi:MAG: flavin reductase family protein [Phycisphaerae bacterium]|jgi:flavin reductase (DIM6/NTAB) family NADH-FMN oxidoreductase RutF
MFLDLTTTDRDWRDVYQLLIGSVNPRPIALVSTISAAGQRNLAPFSFFNMVSGNPPVLIICPSFRRNGSPKDTLLNIREVPEFVVAVVTEAIVEPMTRAAADLPRGDDEFAFAGLRPADASLVRPPLVAESPVNIECRLRQTVEISPLPGGGTVLFGDLVALHIADEVLNPKGRIDPRLLPTIGRLGAQNYATVRHPYPLHVPPPPDAQGPAE